VVGDMAAVQVDQALLLFVIQTVMLLLLQPLDHQLLQHLVGIAFISGLVLAA
jgi:hypothetical protein